MKGRDQALAAWFVDSLTTRGLQGTWKQIKAMRAVRRERHLLDGLQVSERWLMQRRREAHFDRHWEN